MPPCPVIRRRYLKLVSPFLAIGALVLSGCEKKAEVTVSPASAPISTPVPALSPEAVATAEPGDPEMGRFLKEMYLAHGSAAEIKDGWVVVEGGKLRTKAIYERMQSREGVMIQADYYTELASGELIVESFAGLGDDLKSAIADTYRAYLEATFHALLSAALGQPCDHAELMEWEIGGTRRKLTFGSLYMRAKMPDDSWPPVFEGIEKQIKASGLAKGLHWVRYYYAHIPGQEPTVEVLLDNQTWTPLQEQGASLPWPESDKFYSARMFFVVQDE